MSERKPLTLEVMRRMVIDDIDCMAFVVVHDIKGDFDVAAVLDEVFGDGICAAYSVGPVEYKEKDYGKTWVAYAAEPPRLDRSAWEPCERCKPSKNALDRWGPHQFPIDGNEIYCYDTDDGWEGEEINFCPWCSRPLTDAAWEMLEKRLEGNK